jgi:P4 family phage/plasmid primase-like protien
MRNELPLSGFDLSKNIDKLSARYTEHPSLFMKTAFIAKHAEFASKHKLSAMPKIASNSRSMDFMESDDFNMRVSNIKNSEELEFVLKHFLDNLKKDETDLKDAYDYMSILPVSYYGEGSYSKWIRVGWALKHTSSKLLIFWLKLSSKSSTFLYSSIPDLCEQWRKFDINSNSCITKLSLYYWVKMESPAEYDQIRRSSINYFIEQTINHPNEKGGCGDWDIANVLYQFYKYEFVCVSIKANIWYQFKDHRWKEVDSGTSLRARISTEVKQQYTDRIHVEMPDQINKDETEEETQQKMAKRKRTHKSLEISARLTRTNDKKNIMTEAKELFYDGSFLEKMDINPYLLCFKNGVFDFKEKIFRDGRPEDNISMCTNINYIKDFNPSRFPSQLKIVNDINDFMSKLFPEKPLCEYMWSHLASTLLGTSTNQTFNMYIGKGQNGKSVLVSLMELVLGEYKGDVPLSLVTDKRGKVGGLAPEIVQLKGKRYAVMQEPQKGDKINEGVMKQLTSGKDPIQGRAPYMPKTISFYPQFKLVVTCNVLLEIKSNDHGTWRRIRAVPFKSLFTDNPVENDKDKPYQFKLDKCIDEQFNEWKEIFAVMLVKRACETNGIVDDCDIVLQESNTYRQGQDYISQFISDCISKDQFGQIKKMELNNEFSLWYGANYGGRGPSPKDLHEYMDKEFGRHQNQRWSGVKINYNQGSCGDDCQVISEGDSEEVDDFGTDDL